MKPIKEKALYSDRHISEIEKTVLSHSRAKDFLQCKDCIDKFMQDPLHEFISPREYGMYEVSSYVFQYPRGKKAEITVIWCKRCGNAVWDSRRLFPAY